MGFLGLYGPTASLTLNADYKYAYQLRADLSFTARYVTFMNTWATGDGVRIAVYDDNSGEPGDLLCQTSNINGTSADYVQTESFSATTSITAGEYYWIAVHIDAVTDISFVGYTTGYTGRYNSDNYDDGISDPFGSASSNTYGLGVYIHDGTISAQVNDNGLHISPAIVTASGGGIYALACSEDNNLEIWSGIGTTSVAREINDTSTYWLNADCAIDTSDYIHVVAQDNTNEGVYYRRFNTSTDSWLDASWELVGAWSESVSVYSVRIVIDSNDKPHVFYGNPVKMSGSTEENIYYREKTGASWSSETQIGARSTKTDQYRYPWATFRDTDDTLTVSYLGYVSAYYNCLKTYTPGSGWGSETQQTASSAGQFPLCAVPDDTLGTYFWYHFDGYDLEENNSDTSYDGGSGLACVYIGSTRYVFYIDSNDLKVIYNSGSGWTQETLIQYSDVVGVWVESSYEVDNYTNINVLVKTQATVNHGFYGWFQYVLDSGAVELSASSVGTSSTNDDGILNVARELLATMLAASSIGDPYLARQLEFSAALAAASSIGDPALGIIVELAASIIGASSSTDADLAVARELLAAVSGTSSIADAALNVLRAYAGSSTAATTIADVDLLVSGVVEFAAAIAASSATTDADLAVGRALLAAILAASSTADADLDAGAAPAVISGLGSMLWGGISGGSTGGGPVTFSAAINAVSTIADTAVLAVLRAMAATVLAASSTTDADLRIQVQLLAAMTAASTTPDVGLAIVRAYTASISTASTVADPALAVGRALQAALTAASTIADISLDVSGIVEFLASATAASTTPGVDLAVARALAASVVAASTIADPSLDVSGSVEFLAAVTAASTTTDASLDRLLAAAASVVAASSTTDADLAKALQLAASILAASSTTDADMDISDYLQADIQAVSSTTSPAMGVLREMAAAMVAQSQIDNINLGDYFVELVTDLRIMFIDAEDREWVVAGEIRTIYPTETRSVTVDAEYRTMYATETREVEV